MSSKYLNSALWIEEKHIKKYLIHFITKEVFEINKKEKQNSRELNKIKPKRSETRLL